MYKKDSNTFQTEGYARPTKQKVGMKNKMNEQMGEL
jgi:hypothetical protein